MGKLSKSDSVLAVVTGSVVLIVSFVISSSSACSFPAIYNFGDSNSDTGADSVTFGRLPYPNGKTYFGMPSGRTCDGRLIIDFMAEKLGLPLLNSYLDSLQSNFRHGANFAASRATIQQVNGQLCEGRYSPLSLGIQLSEFEQLKVRTNEFYIQANCSHTKVKSGLPRPKDFSKALYTIDCGQNDLYYLVTTMTEDQAKAAIPNITDQFVQVIEKLYQEGARKFWIHNIGPIGCLPLTVIHHAKSGDVDEIGCVKSHNEVAQEFNRQLKYRIYQLSCRLQGVELISVDIYSAKYTLIREATNYGFVNPFEYCCGDDNCKCWETSATNISACNDPSKYISWDSLHDTEAANYWIASRIMNGSFSDPPISLQKAC
ncbi:hypothetical protein Pint_22858 [Pistacia integerrima]|uniref:Uncharacterized protein n=1 Tax=Pistacia integerrima TaxID=434235 RepID=A0ACC0YLB0_9ROSI|nr:hypothetical protein Pint_22858 [Pistacia integerrima]